MNTAGLCKGSTADSDSVCEGSNPSPAAKEKSWKSFDSRTFSCFDRYAPGRITPNSLCLTPNFVVWWIQPYTTRLGEHHVSDCCLRGRAADCRTKYEYDLPHSERVRTDSRERLSNRHLPHAHTAVGAADRPAGRVSPSSPGHQLDGGESGSEVAAFLRKKRITASILYITAYQDCLRDAFYTHALDFWVKPVDEQKLAAALEWDCRKTTARSVLCST